jgi:lipopolysaccharide biosynthesis protein
MNADVPASVAPVRAVAIYLPQYHPIPENDAWWGKGFTEWTNVTKTAPLFPGHHQPHLPSELGFYDLRLPEVRQEQAALARSHGISAFCYYHYWFDGKLLLERPLSEVLRSGKPDFPFMMCWANESWTRTWLGRGRDILMPQTYSPALHRQHAELLTEYFADPRYVRVEGRPAYVVYRPLDVTDAAHMVEITRSVCLERLGVDPYLIASNGHAPRATEKLLSLGFDAVLDFRPQLAALPLATTDKHRLPRLALNLTRFRSLRGSTKIYRYAEALRRMRSGEPETFARVIPSVFVGWDNTPRRGKRGIVLHDNTPELFERELARVKAKADACREGARLVFINAWNEWAEGNHLEPDQKYGRGHLDAVRRVFGDKPV